MTLKRRIFNALVILFALAALALLFSAWQSIRLSRRSEAILKDNFRTVIYVREMRRCISGDSITSPAQFEQNLSLQVANVTEQGELALTTQLQQQYEAGIFAALPSLLNQIEDLNMQAIEDKNASALQFSQRMFWYQLISGLAFITLGITLMLRVPGVLAKPVLQREKDRSLLYATLSHELKTQISTIGLSATLLDDARIGALNQEQQDLLRNIRVEAGKMLKLTGEILELARSESGQIQVHPQPTDAGKLMQYVADTLSLQARHANVILKTLLPAGETMVSADPEKTAWVLINLVSNAIRFSPSAGTVQLSVKADSNTITFAVQDEGRGIAKDHQQKVFDKFYQVPGENKGGTGLGLAISKEFVEAQGGSISLESDEGKGCLFSVVLKRAD